MIRMSVANPHLELRSDYVVAIAHLELLFDEVVVARLGVADDEFA